MSDKNDIDIIQNHQNSSRAYPKYINYQEHSQNAAIFFWILRAIFLEIFPSHPPWYPSPPCSPPLRPAPAAPPGSGCQGLHPKRPGRPNPQGPWKNGWKIRTSSDVFFWVIFMNISSLEDFDDFAFLGVARKLPDGMLQLELSWTLRKSYL